MYLISLIGRFLFLETTSQVTFWNRLYSTLFKIAESWAFVILFSYNNRNARAYNVLMSLKIQI